MLSPSCHIRLFLTFRNPQGWLIGASHGKFFSDSDIDFTQYNPVTNPPPVSQFKAYTALNSTDGVIQAAGHWLLQTYLGWELIPELNIVVTINGILLWVSNTYVTTMVCYHYGLSEVDVRSALYDSY